MKNTKFLSISLVLTFILAACGSAINGTYNVQQTGGLLQLSNGYSNQCSQTSLTINQSGNSVSGSATNPCYSEQITGGSVSGNSISNLRIVLTPSGGATAYTNPYNSQYPQYNTGQQTGQYYPYYNQYPQQYPYNNYNYGNTSYGYGTQGSVGCSYIGTLNVSGSGSGSLITGTLQLDNPALRTMCTEALTINGTKN